MSDPASVAPASVAPASVAPASVAPASVAPAKVGFVSLGCPKALVDSERILTQLRGDGYTIVGSYQDADVVVVNTCGFIDSAKAESLEAIGEAIAENGKVIVTGCLGAQAQTIRDRHPEVLSSIGNHTRNITRVTDIRGDEVCADFLGNRGTFRASAANDHPRFVLNEPFGCRETDTGCAAGNQGSLVC